MGYIKWLEDIQHRCVCVFMCCQPAPSSRTHCTVYVCKKQAGATPAALISTHTPFASLTHKHTYSWRGWEQGYREVNNIVELSTVIQYMHFDCEPTSPLCLSCSLFLSAASLAILSLTQIAHKYLHTVFFLVQKLTHDLFFFVSLQTSVLFFHSGYIFLPPQTLWSVFVFDLSWCHSLSDSISTSLAHSSIVLTQQLSIYCKHSLLSLE